MRVLGLDYGSVRIGVAVSDPDGIIAQPGDFIPAEPEKECILNIKSLCSKLSVEKIVIGLPLHMNGDEGESALAARNLGRAIQESMDIPVCFIDERLSTLSAEKALREANVKGTKKKEKVDSVAAAIILQSYLDREAVLKL
jgi:putative Holliday junction resolvase